VAYVLLIERMERRVLADRQALLSRGITDGLPSVDEEQAAFDAYLISEAQTAEQMTPTQLALHEELVALGVA
jgi:hypothetical protein